MPSGFLPGCAVVPSQSEVSRAPAFEDKRGYLRNLQPGDVVRPHEHPEHVDMSLTRPTEMAPGFNHHTKSLRRLKKEAFATAEAARLEADIAKKE